MGPTCTFVWPFVCSVGDEYQFSGVKIGLNTLFSAGEQAAQHVLQEVRADHGDGRDAPDRRVRRREPGEGRLHFRWKHRPDRHRVVHVAQEERRGLLPTQV